MDFKIDYVREQFPALAKTVNGVPAAFLDGPGGTQVPIRVVNKINEYLYYRNANSHGQFATSMESDSAYWENREVYADFLNCSPNEIAFGANTSSNIFKLALGLVRTMKPGDEVIITNIDHEGNRSPWRTLIDFGIVIKSVKIDTKTVTLDFEDFKSKLSDKTKVIAINWAANSCGTISDVKKFITEAHKFGAITVVDAVHYAPHKPIDVKAIDTDILLCSAYKFCGPHIGIMYVHERIANEIKSVRVMAEDNTEPPFKFETGTVAMELAAGAAEAVEFIADIGKEHMNLYEDRVSHLEGRRKNIVAGMLAIDEYESGLAEQLRKALSKFPEIKIYGAGGDHPKTSTVSFTIHGVNSGEVGKFLGNRGLFAWDGDFYAIETICHALKLGEKGGLVRIGFAPYNIQSDVDRVVAAVEEFLELKKQ